MTTTMQRYVGAAILGTGVAAGVLIALDWTSPLRVVLALAFLLFGPGLALAELLDLRDLAQVLVVAIGVSLGLDTVVSLSLLYAGAYSVGAAFGIVLAVSAAMLAIALRRAA
jgi:hypothetical protein